MANEKKTPTTVERLLDACKRTPGEQLLQFHSWTDADGNPVVFRIRELSFNQVREIQQLSSGADFPAAIITAGVIEPNLRDERLQQACGAATPTFFAAGDAESFSPEVERLRLTGLEAAYEESRAQ